MANLTVPIKIELKDEIGVIRYLLDEIDVEMEYNRAYKLAQERAEKEAQEKGGYFWDYMGEFKFSRSPRQSVINDNIKTIRRLALKIGLEV